MSQAEVNDKSSETSERCREKILSEMSFHISVKSAFSSRGFNEIWARASGAARGALRAHRLSKNGVSDIETELQEKAEMLKNGDRIIEGPDSDIQKCLDEGFVYGLQRGYEIANGDEPLSEKHGARARK